MNKITTGIASILLSASASYATAGSDSGFYLGGSVASSKLKIDDSELDLDDTQSTYKIFGGYNFGIIPLLDLAVEGSYLNLGKFGASNGELETNALALSGLAALSFGPFGLFAKTGLVNWNSEVSGFGGDSDSDSGNDPAYGVGAKFQIGSLQLRAEYEIFTLDDADIDFASIGAAYTF